MTEKKPLVIENRWRDLRQFTDARIGLGRAGISLPTSELLAFQLAHARARDAVHLPLDTARLLDGLNSLGARLPSPGPLRLQSRAADRQVYLQRPDLGRSLDAGSAAQLSAPDTAPAKPRLAIVIADGLSSCAVQNNAVPMLTRFLDDLEASGADWDLAPLSIVEQGRVAIGDEIGERLGASAVVVLIGERPGLSSPDSLGVYLTWAPCGGLNDARRNCISNVRPAGLSFENASQRLLYLLREAQRLGTSGVDIKDRTEEVAIGKTGNNQNFLTN
ncbi:ethanolamine ammonia-lyase subunit EutC [Granulosicoccaceae sp. 1_MG-2023]|nr:ethanolamine ammonia-lyase subunit EutC [Granulosicoccaceae sp. 1_MG-2023]